MSDTPTTPTTTRPSAALVEIERQFRAFCVGASQGPPRLKYFIRTNFGFDRERGFTNLAQAEGFVRRAIERFGLDWRAGWVFRVRGIGFDIEVVDGRGNRPKNPADLPT